MDGLELTRLLAEPVRAVVVTTFDLDSQVYAALRHGAVRLPADAVGARVARRGRPRGDGR